MRFFLRLNLFVFFPPRISFLSLVLSLISRSPYYYPFVYLLDALSIVYWEGYLFFFFFSVSFLPEQDLGI